MSSAWALRAAPLAWIALLASIAAWPLTATGTGPALALMAGLPLFLPMPGMVRGMRRTLAWAPWTLAPAIAIAVMEIVAIPGARIAAGLTLAFILAALAAAIAALRAASGQLP